MIPNSLKEIIERLTEIVRMNLPEIVTVKYTGTMNTDLPRDFPTLYLFCEDPSTLNENHNLITLQMYFTDVQISQNDEWKKDYEIKSDMMQAASKLFDILENEGWLDTVGISIQPFTSDMNDGLSGVQCSVAFIVQKPCLIEEYEQGTPTPEPITITITSPITGEEFEEGIDITVSYSLSTEEGITDVAIEIDGVEVQRKTVIFDAFLIEGLDASSHSIVLKAYNGGELVATSNIVNIVVEALPFFVTINEPTEAQTFTEGDDIAVDYSFNRVNGDVTKKELWVNGAVVDSQTGSTPSPFTISSATEGAKEIEVRVFEGAAQVASDVVNVTVEAVAATLLLDLYSNTAGESWSLEQINSNFTGNILELRRDDNDTMLVQFDAGQLPQAAIAAWAGSGKAYVTKWYGQSGNGLFVHQTNAANQPWIYDNGFVLENGKVAMRFDGNQYLHNSLSFLKGDFNTFVVAISNFNTIQSIVESTVGTTDKVVTQWLDTRQSPMRHSSHMPRGVYIDLQSQLATDTQYLLAMQNVSGSSNGYVNGIDQGSVLAGVRDSLNSLYVGYHPSASIFLQGRILEINIYDDNQSANRSAITTEIMTRYGIS